MRAEKAGRSWLQTAASLSSSACKHPVKLRSWASMEGAMCVCKEGNKRSSQAGVSRGQLAAPAGGGSSGRAASDTQQALPRCQFGFQGAVICQGRQGIAAGDPPGLPEERLHPVNNDQPVSVPGTKPQK